MDKSARKIFIQNYTKDAIDKSNPGEVKEKNKFSDMEDRHYKKEKTNSRKELIKHAMTVYRSKRYIIDALPREQREKLMFMALKIFGEQNDKSKLD